MPDRVTAATVVSSSQASERPEPVMGPSSNGSVSRSGAPSASRTMPATQMPDRPFEDTIAARRAPSRETANAASSAASGNASEISSGTPSSPVARSPPGFCAGTLQTYPRGSMDGSRRPARSSTRRTSPSAVTRTTAPPEVRTAAASRSGATCTAAASTCVMAEDSPSIGVSSSPERKPNPSAVSTRGLVATRVERTDTVSADRGVESAVRRTSVTPAEARLACSWV